MQAEHKDMEEVVRVQSVILLHYWIGRNLNIQIKFFLQLISHNYYIYTESSSNIKIYFLFFDNSNALLMRALFFGQLFGTLFSVGYEIYKERLFSLSTS